MEIVKKLRVRIDALIQAAKTAICSAETTLAYRELQLAKAWLGKSLGYLGNASPYPAVDSVDKIPATTEVSESPFQLPGDPHQNANALRDEIESIVGAVVANTPSEHRQKDCFDECAKCLFRAKFWLGYEIGRIRDTPTNAPAHLSQQPLTINEAKMDAITNTDTPELPTEAERAEADEAFEKPQPFVVEKVVPGHPDTVAFASFGGEKGVDGIIEQPKISKDENQGSQEKQPKTPRKKG